MSSLRARLPHALAQAVQDGVALERAVLFGSLARGTFHPDRSDIDLLVRGCSDPFLLAGTLECLLGFPVHAVPEERAPASLLEAVARDGVEVWRG